MTGNLMTEQSQSLNIVTFISDFRTTTLNRTSIISGTKVLLKLLFTMMQYYRHYYFSDKYAPLMLTFIISTYGL